MHTIHTVYQRINASTQPSQPYDYTQPNLMDPLHWFSHLSTALNCLELDWWRIYSQFKFTPFAGHNISAPPFLRNNTNDKTETKTTAWCRSQGGCISIYKCIQLKNYKMHQQPNFAPRCTFLIITSLHYTSCMEYCVLLLYSIVTFLCQICFLSPNLGSSQHSRHNSSAIICDWVVSKWAPNWLNFPMKFSKTSLVGAL